MLEHLEGHDYIKITLLNITIPQNAHMDVSKIIFIESFKSCIIYWFYSRYIPTVFLGLVQKNATKAINAAKELGDKSIFAFASAYQGAVIAINGLFLAGLKQIGDASEILANSREIQIQTKTCNCQTWRS